MKRVPFTISSCAILLFGFSISVALAHADTGVFAGNGQNSRMITSKTIRLVSAGGISANTDLGQLKEIVLATYGNDFFRQDSKGLCLSAAVVLAVKGLLHGGPQP